MGECNTKGLWVHLYQFFLVVFLLTRARDVMSFMVQAYNLGMSQSKQYAFVSVDFAFGSKWNYASLGYSENFIKSVITRGLITVSAIRPNNSESAYEKFLDDVRYRVKQPPFNDTRLENKTSVSNIPFLCSLYG